MSPEPDLLRDPDGWLRAALAADPELRRDFAAMEDPLDRALAADPGLARCLHPQNLDDIACCYGSGGSDGERLVDAAIDAGKIDRGARSRWIAYAERQPEITRSILAEMRPSPLQAEANYWGDATTEALVAEIEARWGS